MLIKVLDVSDPKEEKNYSTLNVQYRNSNGEVSGKKLVSFSNESVYKYFEGLKVPKEGVEVEVRAVKKGNFWNWVEAREPGDHPEEEVSVKSTTNKQWVPDADRQKLIVRQSSISNAVSTLKVDKAAADPKEVLELAQKYFDWVMGNDPIKELIDMKDDVPQ